MVKVSATAASIIAAVTSDPPSAAMKALGRMATIAGLAGYELRVRRVLVAGATVIVELDETVDDATITTRVKTSLLNDPDVAALRIDVDTFKGVVTLSGAVKTAAERDKAIALARKIGGVTDVKSTLQIQP